MQRFCSLFGIVVAIALISVRPAAAQGARYAVIVQGASGDPQYATQHRAWVDSLATVLRDKLGFDADHILLLTEEPKANEQKSTAEVVKATMARLAKDTKADDLVFVMLIGHGSGDGPAAKFNLVGPDLTAAEWAALFDPIAARVAIVDSTSSSFAYLAGLSGKNRIVITATGSFAQRYHTVFPDAFIAALTAPTRTRTRTDGFQCSRLSRTRRVLSRCTTSRMAICRRKQPSSTTTATAKAAARSRRATTAWWPA
jgi:hypothetical protein